jgi:glutamyl-tRNA synthetase
MASVPPTVRVRFPPSPTGALHLGSARTALYNWLFARHHRGALVLRIEDTDRARSTPEHVEQALRVLEWLGIGWDEGPFLQSDRLDVYADVARRLREEGKAYPCYCTAEELAGQRERQRERGEPLVYSGRCRRLSERERAELEVQGRRPALRLFVPAEGRTTIEDAVRGSVTWDNAQLGDHVILRSDGMPTYQFANPFDDIAMGITHVIRGEDLLSSTPRQLALYDALSATRPTYAHLSMILGPDRKKFSKRHGAVSVEEFRERGYLPDAMCNFLALLGWSYDEKTTVMTRDELIERFTLERVNPSPAVFDAQKLEWLNGEHLRALDEDEYAAQLLSYLRAAGSPLAAHEERVREVVPLVREKLRELGQFEAFAAFLFGPAEIEPAAWSKVAADGATGGRALAAVEQDLAALPSWTTESIEGALRAAAEETGLKPRVLFLPVRVAVSGRLVAPGLFESLALLGRDESLARLRAAAARLDGDG